MTPKTLLDLGRVSNLPTVWTNVLAGAVLSGGAIEPVPMIVLAAAASSLYVGGMFLNDAFDRDFDARLRPERPIPSGRAAARHVFAIGFGLLVAGAGLVVASSRLQARSFDASLPSWAPLLAATALAALIVLYDAFHKGHPSSAALMGACRALLYVMAAVSVGAITREALVGVLVLFAYVVGLTLVARFEARHPRLRGLVGRLIAGICLVDATLIALQGPWALAAMAALGFPLTLAGQRLVKGT